ncbi:MAG: branched-chain amino acid ABC transporter permease [Desulfomonilaceae bacterium]|nr:branched-chain amino acid ABC transporter permease [Desulfomonilaceae bacterium]
MTKRGLFSKKNLTVLAVLLLAAALPFIAPYEGLASEILIFALFAMAFDLVLGYAGMLSFGHAAFFGIGAYGAGILLIRVYPSVLLALLGSVLVSSVAAFLIGFASIRRRGIYFTMVTLAFAQMFYFIAFKWTALTGGDDGLQGVPRPSVGPLDLGPEINLYYFILFVVVISTAIMVRVVNSPFGSTLQALRENRNRTMSIGYDVDRFKLMAFVISGFFSGLAGGLYALLQNFVPLSSLYWTTSGEVVVMTIAGGMGTLFGPALGAFGIILLRDVISNYTESWSFFMGVLFMVAVLGFRGGIIGVLRDRLKVQV